MRAVCLEIMQKGRGWDELRMSLGVGYIFIALTVAGRTGQTMAFPCILRDAAEGLQAVI